MANVPDDSVMGRVVDVMEGDSQFDRAEVGGKMPTGARDRLQDKGPQFVSKLFKLATIQRLEVRWLLNTIKQICRHISRQ